MHPEGANEISLHHPESLCQQQSAWDLNRNAVHHLAPELYRDTLVELGGRHAVLRARWNRPARTRRRIPQPLNMPLRQGHRSVEADDRKEPGHMQDSLDHLLAHRGIQIIELRRVVPRKTCAVIAVIYVARVARPLVAALKDHSRIRLLIVVVFNFDLDTAIA